MQTRYYAFQWINNKNKLIVYEYYRFDTSNIFGRVFDRISIRHIHDK